jgi:hypothetical protein
MPALTYIYIASILTAFISSLISFRLDLPFHLKLFSCLLGLTFLVEVSAATLAYGFHRKNNWVYNSFMLVEFWVYAYFYFCLIRRIILRRILYVFLVIFPIFWLVTVIFFFGFRMWDSYVVIVGSFFSVLFALMYYYCVVTARDIVPLRMLPEFWVATGMLIFYLGAFPYFGLLNFLVKNHLEVAQQLLVVLQVLDTLMYILFSYGYLCRIVNTKKS